MLKLTASLEAWTPIVQAIDCALMLFCGVYCLKSTRKKKNAGLTTLAIACFLSAVVLLGFFLSAAPNNKPLFALSAYYRSFAYLTARLLALAELPLFIIGIVMVARENKNTR
jgi:lipopolysaccharide export LptBFGC system permease protein LptF